MSIALLFVFTSPLISSAHEVYVLSPQEIQTAIHTPSASPLTIIEENAELFSFWAFIALLLVFGVFFISITRILETNLDPFFQRTKHWAPFITRLTVGLSFLAGAFYQASYGPEIPLVGSYGSLTPLITALLVIIGILFITNRFTVFASVIALTLFSVAVYHLHWYMLTYVNYLGEFLMLILVGLSFGKEIKKKMEPIGFLVLRILFGTSLIYSSLYAKIIHSNLALDTVNFTDPSHGIMYPLTHYLHFTPPFLVLGAACVEVAIGLFFILGIEIRFTALFLNFWLFLSLIHFGEIVWPHIILIGIPIAFFFYGYDKYSLEGYFFKKGDEEPVL